MVCFRYIIVNTMQKGHNKDSKIACMFPENMEEGVDAVRRSLYSINYNIGGI